MAPLPPSVSLSLDATLDLLLDSMDDQGCLEQDVFVVEDGTLLPKGAKIMPFGAWHHVTFGVGSWRGKARAHVRQMVRTSGGCTTRYFPGDLYTCPNTALIWRYFGEWLGEELWRWEP